MIASIRGEVISKTLGCLILEVNGIGYELLMSAAEYDQLIVGTETKLFVHENIREDAYDLYGFTSESGKQLFELLISVKNVGPKVALAILNIGDSTKIRTAIAGGDLVLLMSAKGVGKRAAEQLIVELRDKVGLIASTTADDVVLRGAIDKSDEALQAMVSLGYSEQDAAAALASVDPELSVNERLKRALKGSVKWQSLKLN